MRVEQTSALVSDIQIFIEARDIIGDRPSRARGVISELLDTHSKITVNEGMRVLVICRHELLETRFYVIEKKRHAVSENKTPTLVMHEEYVTREQVRAYVDEFIDTFVKAFTGNPSP